MKNRYCCDEYARATGFSRRVFIRTGGLAMVSFGFAPRFVGRALGATVPSTGGRKVLVCVFQRGAVDGLNMIVPHGDKEYYKARDNIAGFYCRAIIHLNIQFHAWIDQGKRVGRSVETCDHAGLARCNNDAELGFRRNGRVRGQITCAAKVF